MAWEAVDSYLVTVGVFTAVHGVQMVTLSQLGYSHLYMAAGMRWIVTLSQLGYSQLYMAAGRGGG